MAMAIGNFLTTEDVARVLRVSVGRVRQFVMERRLIPLQKVGSVLFFDPAQVDAFSKIPRRPGPKKSDK